jgi:hypothetical protein
MRAARHLKSLLARVPAPLAAATAAAAPGGALLLALSSSGLFETRVTRAPELPPAPSPWLVATAVAKDDAACQLSVRVVDERGDVVDDAPLKIAKLGAGVVEAGCDALTDHKGTHRLIDLARGSYDVTVDVAGKALQGTPTFRCDQDGKRAFFDVVVKDSDRVVTGTIHGVRGGKKQPLAYATVAVFQDLANRNALGGVVRVRTDGDGQFSARLPAGQYVAYATANDHVAAKTHFTVDAPLTQMQLALAFMPSVSGVVVDDAGVPVAGAVVAMGNAYDPRAKASAVVADSSGRFRLPVHEGQELTLTARGDGKIGRTFVGVVTAERAPEVRIVASVGRTVSGVVTTPTGKIVAFGDVQFRIKSLGVEGTARTDASGRFVLDGMPQNEPVEVWAKGNATGAWGARVAEPTTSPTQLALLYIPPAY